MLSQTIPIFFAVMTLRNKIAYEQVISFFRTLDYSCEFDKSKSDAKTFMLIVPCSELMHMSPALLSSLKIPTIITN